MRLTSLTRVEDLGGVDDRVGHGRQVGHAAALRGGDAEHGEQQAAGRVAHVVPQRHGVVDVAVHRREHAADVAVAQQAAPPASQLFRVRRLVSRELPDVSQHCASYLLVSNLSTPRTSVVCRGRRR